MNKQGAGYREILMAELLRRVKNNSAYSLRRFAQQLGVSPATLSEVLSKKRKLSPKAAVKIAAKLSLDPQSEDTFYRSVFSEQAKQPGSQMERAAAPEYLKLREDVFQVVSEWYYYAILELTYVESFKSEARWIATRLGLSHIEARDAIERLLELGLLEKRRGRLVKTSAHIASTTDVPAQAIRKRHTQILAKATASLEAHGVDERDVTAMTMSIDPALLGEAKQRIAAFRRELCQFLESGKRKRVYEFSMQLFPLSTKEQI